MGALFQAASEVALPSQHAIQFDFFRRYRHSRLMVIAVSRQISLYQTYIILNHPLYSITLLTTRSGINNTPLTSISARPILASSKVKKSAQQLFFCLTLYL